MIKEGKAGECSSISIPNVYIKLPVMKANKKGVLVKKQEYSKVAIVATIRLLEDIDVEQPVTDLSNPDDKAAHFKGAYLLISNRYDATEEAVNSYAKRWKIEIFYRNTKQVYFAINAARFTSFFKKFWPKYYDLGFGLSPLHYMERTS